MINASCKNRGHFLHKNKLMDFVHELCYLIIHYNRSVVRNVIVNKPGTFESHIYATVRAVVFIYLSTDIVSTPLSVVQSDTAYRNVVPVSTGCIPAFTISIGYEKENQ